MPGDAPGSRCACPETVIPVSLTFIRIMCLLPSELRPGPLCVASRRVLSHGWPLWLPARPAIARRPAGSVKFCPWCVPCRCAPSAPQGPSLREAAVLLQLGLVLAPGDGDVFLVSPSSTKELHLLTPGPHSCFHLPLLLSGLVGGVLLATEAARSVFPGVLLLQPFVGVEPLAHSGDEGIVGVAAVPAQQARPVPRPHLVGQLLLGVDLALPCSVIRTSSACHVTSK